MQKVMSHSRLQRGRFSQFPVSDTAKNRIIGAAECERSISWIATAFGMLILCMIATNAGAQSSLESVNYPQHFIRHANWLGELASITNSLDRADATFKIVEALNRTPGAISFESVNYPGHFLRHQNSRLKLAAFEDNQLFRDDASFMRRPGLADAGASSFESVNYPGTFIRHRDWHLWVERNDGTALFSQDATFHEVSGLATAQDLATGCDKYANDAVEAQNYNVDHDCGFFGPSWSTDRRAHYAWCSGASDADVKSQNDIRNRLIWACQNLDHDCLAYSESAVAQNWANHNMSNQPGIITSGDPNMNCEGPRWSDDRAAHEHWCLNVSPEQRRKEATDRAKLLRSHKCDF